MQQNGNGADDTLRIVSLHATNFRRLSLARVRIDQRAGLVRISGGNAQGKTSLLRIVPDTLFGTRKISGTPLKDGAESGECGLSLSNGWTVERTYDEKNPKGKLVVKGVDGGRHNQDKLNALLGDVSIDPFALFGLDAKQRAALYLSLSPDPELPAKLAALRDRRADLEEERTPHIATTRGRSGIVQPRGERPEPVDTGAEMQRLRELEAKQKARDELVARRLGTADKDGVMQGGAQQRIAKGQAAIAELERRLAEARELLADIEQQDADLAAAIDAMPDHAPAIEAVRQHIADARAIDEQLKPWTAYDAAIAAVETSESEQKRLNAEIKEVTGELNALLADARIPVDGLTFYLDGTPLLNGRPEADWSGRERVDVAVDVGFALKPRLRLILLDEDANSLDLPALERLDQRAKEQDFLVLAVRIGLEGPGEIVVDDGIARNRDDDVASVQALAAAEVAADEAAAEQEAAEEAERQSRMAAREQANPDMFEIDHLPGSAAF